MNYLRPRIIVGQNLLPGVTRFCHGLGAVLAHAHPVPVACGLDADLPWLKGDPKSCGTQAKELTDLGARKGLAADHDAVHTAKLVIQEGYVEVNDEVCTMRGKKLYPGDTFRYEGQTYLISIHGA